MAPEVRDLRDPYSYFNAESTVKENSRIEESTQSQLPLKLKLNVKDDLFSNIKISMTWDVALFCLFSKERAYTFPLLFRSRPERSAPGQTYAERSEIDESQKTEGEKLLRGNHTRRNYLLFLY